MRQRGGIPRPGPATSLAAARGQAAAPAIVAHLPGQSALRAPAGRWPIPCTPEPRAQDRQRQHDVLSSTDGPLSAEGLAENTVPSSGPERPAVRARGEGSPAAAYR